MPGRFRLTKSKFQIFTIFSILSTSTSKFFQFCQIFQFSIFFLFLQILPLSLILVSSAGGGVFSKMIVRHTKILLLFQILTVVFSWDWSWEFDRSWSGPYQKFLKLENFGKCFQLGKAGIVLVLNCPKFPNFGKAENFFQNEKKFEKLENSGGAEFCRVRTNKPYIPKKSSFFSPLIRSGPASQHRFFLTT